MDELIRPAVKAVKDGEIRLVPERMEKIYFNWTDNIRDWCISRQLWWGHRIPAYYCDKCKEVVVAKEMPKTCGKCGGEHFTQDPDTFIRKTHIIARRISCHQSQPQCIRTVFIDYFQRVYAVSKGFAHFPPLRIPHKPMKQYRMERFFPHLLVARENHADNPEENNIISRHQHIRRIKIVQFFRFLRPT